MIYIVTTFAKQEDNRIVRQRSVGYFEQKEEAFYAVHHNVGDLNEAGYYPYATIEETEEGIYPIPANFWFFEWDKKAKEYLLLEDGVLPDKTFSFCLG